MGLYTTTTTLDLVMVGVNFAAADMTTLASKMIDQAEAEINGVLARRYDLSQDAFQTTTSIPPQVRQWAENLSEGRMWMALSRGGAGKESMERGRGLVKMVREDLKLLAEYKAELLATSGSLIQDMSNTSFRVMCNTSTYTPTIDEGDELNWRVDSDKLDDISNAKD